MRFKLLATLAVLCSASLALVNCSRNPASSGEAAFKSASPELKAQWDGAMAAMKTNGYAAALTILQQLRSAPGLTAEQGKAVDQTATHINDQMYEKANAGDPDAKKALEDLHNLRNRQ